MTTAILEPKQSSGEKRHSKGVEARKRRRLRVSLPVQVQPFDARFAEIMDVGEVTDFSREGLYFLSCMPHYFTGMRLILKFPFGEKVSAHKKFLGTVVRLEERTDGTQGVAVQFLL
ncbi:MAG TPA: PilZ domain-containing protein [Candidatus Acidoferrum sp.]|nr:PilZ domain-containing protein [Candidatus Acidoferrum sp.]